MARSEELVLQGKCKWAHVKRPNQFGDWSIELYPTAESLPKIEKLIEEGIKNRLKKDDDGYNIRFKRPVTKEDRQGRKFTLEPPVVLDKDRRHFDGMIGNGSDVTILLEVYGGTSRGGVGTYKAARLKGVKVDNLVPYDTSSIESDRERKTTESLQEAPDQAPVW